MTTATLLTTLGLILVAFSLGYKLGLKHTPTSDKSNYRK